jgi:hypothetical protein
LIGIWIPEGEGDLVLGFRDPNKYPTLGCVGKTLNMVRNAIK